MENLALEEEQTEEEIEDFKNFPDLLTESIEMAQVAYRRDSHIVGVTTGLTDLDKWLGGLHSSDLLIIAGRPSMGKTILATNIAFNAAVASMEANKSGASVAFFSLEMSAEQLATRILASESGVTSDKIRRGEIRAEDFPTFVEVSRRLSSIPWFCRICCVKQKLGIKCLSKKGF